MLSISRAFILPQDLDVLGNSTATSVAVQVVLHSEAEEMIAVMQTAAKFL